MTDVGVDLTGLLGRMRRGDAAAAEDVMRLIYDELHRLAAGRMRHEAKHHTLQPTALVHEAYLRLMHGPLVVQNRQHFLALAAQAMRRVLVDHARGRGSQKRGGDWNRITLEGVPGSEGQNLDVLMLHGALGELAILDARAAQIVELKFFGGYTDNEVGEILDVSLPTVRRDWVFARAWLKTRLEPRGQA
jgi:RNA polymerase sigma factor (TIGR02999 family)